MSKNRQQGNEGGRPVQDDVRGGHNPTRYEQRPKPPAQPPAKPKDK